MKTTNLVRIQLGLLAVALVLQLSPVVTAAQKKEDPNSAPIVVSVDAQKKEDPNSRPVTTVSERFRSWLASWIVSTDAQKKE